MQNRSKRAILRTLRNLNRDRQELSYEQSAEANAINNAKPSRAIGPDGLSTLILEKLDC